MKGFLKNDAPIQKDPINPGPLVYATAFSSFLLMLASEIAWVTTGIMFC